MLSDENTKGFFSDFYNKFKMHLSSFTSQTTFLAMFPTSVNVIPCSIASVQTLITLTWSTPKPPENSNPVFSLPASSSQPIIRTARLSKHTDHGPPHLRPPFKELWWLRLLSEKSNVLTLTRRALSHAFYPSPLLQLSAACLSSGPALLTSTPLLLSLHWPEWPLFSTFKCPWLSQ